MSLHYLLNPAFFETPTSRMTAKMQAACLKTHRKCGLQDSAIIIQQKLSVPSSTFGRPAISTQEEDVTIESGCKIEWLNAYNVDAAGLLKVGDLKVTIPGSLVTQNQLEKAVLVYKGEVYSIKSKQPSQIVGGGVINWIVIARREENH